MRDDKPSQLLEDAIAAQAAKTINYAQQVQRLERIKDNIQSTTGKPIDYDAATGRYKVEMADGSISYAKYNSNAAIAMGETMSLVSPKHSQIGSIDKSPRQP